MCHKVKIEKNGHIIVWQIGIEPFHWILGFAAWKTIQNYFYSLEPQRENLGPSFDYSITNVIWTGLTDKKYIESNAAHWRQRLNNIWDIGIKLSVIVDTYTNLCYTDKKSPVV